MKEMNQGHEWKLLWTHEGSFVEQKKQKWNCCGGNDIWQNATHKNHTFKNV